MKRVLACLLFALPPLALAAGDSGWISLSSTNIQIISDGSPRAFIYATVNNGGCSNSTPELIMDSTNPLGASMYATLVAAKTSGQAVDIETIGCSSTGSPLVVAIYLGS